MLFRGTSILENKFVQYYNSVTTFKSLKSLQASRLSFQQVDRGKHRVAHSQGRMWDVDEYFDARFSGSYRFWWHAHCSTCKRAHLEL